MDVTTQVLALDDLDPRTAHDLFKLRQDVFIVEQGDPYDDLDGRDTTASTRHVLMRDADGTLVGCARVLEASHDDAPAWRVGRVVLAPDARGRGLSTPLMQAALDACPDRPVVLAAQTPLVDFYAGFGFTVCGEEFLDGSIPHLPMVRA